MDVMILAGGKGTRMAELTGDIPKGLATIGPRPILWHIMRHFAAFGHRRFILCVGYKGEQIQAYFDGPGSEPGWEVVTSDAGLEASKSERIAAALPLVRGQRFWLAYGDDLANVDLDAVQEHAEATRSIVTLTAVRPHSPFGVIDIAEDGTITGFREKSLMEDWVNGGFMSIDVAIGDYLHHGELEQEVFGALLADGRLNAHRHQGFWKAMNTYKQYLELNELLEQGQPPWTRRALAQTA